MTDATLCAVYRGVYPPINPSYATLWVSESAKDIAFSDSPADRNVIITPVASGFEGGICQEPNIFYNTVLNNYGMWYGGASSTGYASCTGDPSIAANWVKLGTTAILGNGNGGQANHALHGRLYVEGTTLYYTFYDDTATTLVCATSSMAAPTTITALNTIMALPHLVSGFGNSILLQRGPSDYVLFYEGNVSGAGYQLGIATGTSPIGTFTPINVAMPTLWNVYQGDATTGIGGWTVGGPRPFLENGEYILNFHSAASGAVSSEIYRATSNDAQQWTIDLNGYPLVRRRLYQESSQVADICITHGASGGYWGFWTAYNNTAGAASIVCSPALTAIKRWDGFSWATYDRVAGIQPSDFNTSSYVFTGAHTASNLEDVTCDVHTAGFTVTLSRADVGSRVRVSNVSTSASNVVTVVANAGDTAIAATTIANGTWLEFRCSISGHWLVK